MAITSPLSPTFPMMPVTPSNITFPWSVGLGLGFHSATTGEAAAAGQHRHHQNQQQHEQKRDDSYDSIDIEENNFPMVDPTDANANINTYEDTFTAMDIDTTNNMNLEDLNIDLGMNIDFEDEAVTGIQTTDNAVAGGTGDDVDMTSSAAAPPAAHDTVAMEFVNDAVDVNIDNNVNNNMLTVQNQQAGLADSTLAGDVDLDHILSSINVNTNADVNNDNYANANGSSSDFTALPIEVGTNHFLNTLTTDNTTNIAQKNPTNLADDILFNPASDEKFLSSLDNIDFDPNSLLYSDSLVQQTGHGAFGNVILPGFSVQTHQVGINQRDTAALTNKSNSRSNSYSTDPKSPEARCHNFTAEKPKYDLRHPWVRVNDTTQGKNNRSGKINQYKPTALYKVEAEALKNWRSNGYRFKYNQIGELSEPTYSADQIKTYLYNFQTSAERKLKLWIQRAPADSARRYATPESSKCRFRDCPSRRMMNGTIMHGHFRVAFDERWNRYGDDVDPFAAVSGYAHLYCMERFLDFADVCAKLDVEVDTRSLSKEPRHRWAAGLIGTPECEVAHCFLKKCRSGQLEPEFSNYPLHEEGSLASKRHEQTLTFGMHNARYKTLRPKRLREGQSEAPKTSTLYIHFGDVERFCIGRLAERKSQNQNQNQNQSQVNQPMAHTSSSIAAQASTATSNTQTVAHHPAKTTITSNPSSFPTTRFPNIDTIMKDASVQTDMSPPQPLAQPRPRPQPMPMPMPMPTPMPMTQAQAQAPTTSSSVPSLFPTLFPPHSTNTPVQTTTTTTTPTPTPSSLPLPSSSSSLPSSDLKRKRSFHRPEPIRTDLNGVIGRRRRSRSHGHGHGHADADADANANANKRPRPEENPPSNQTLDMEVNYDHDHADEPLSALMRGLLSELENDEENEDEENEEDDEEEDENAKVPNVPNVPNSGASLDSLFGS